MFRKPRRIYLDFASSTPLDARMHRTFPKLSESVVGANPSALHNEGVRARRVIQDARSIVAKTLHAHSDEIIFTSGATESDNLALIGAIEAFVSEGIDFSKIAVITSTIEHAAVLETIAPYKNKGLFISILPTNEGVVDPKHITIPEGIKALIVSVMYVNNEIGTVQPIKEIAKRIRKLRKEYPDTTILFHTDATQAPLYFNLRVDQLGVDMLTLGATKLYTHKGVGVLYKKRTVSLMPIMRGGGQERGLRPGTEPIELIYTFAHALKYAQEKREDLPKQPGETTRITELQTYFEQQLTKILHAVVITHLEVEPPSYRSPHITHIGIQGMDSELLVIELDAKGIAVSSKSACKNDPSTSSGQADIFEQLYEKDSSFVQGSGGAQYGTVRFSFGRTTTKKELDRAISALKQVLTKYNV